MFKFVKWLDQSLLRLFYHIGNREVDKIPILRKKTVAYARVHLSRKPGIRASPVILSQNPSKGRSMPAFTERAHTFALWVSRHALVLKHNSLHVTG